jgi:hypothetical protein
MGKATKAQKILQLLGALGLCLIYSVLIHKGYKDISTLLENHPDDFLRALGRYFIHNLVGDWKNAL